MSKQSGPDSSRRPESRFNAIAPLAGHRERAEAANNKRYAEEMKKADEAAAQLRRQANGAGTGRDYRDDNATAHDYRDIAQETARLTKVRQGAQDALQQATGANNDADSGLGGHSSLDEDRAIYDDLPAAAPRVQTPIQPGLRRLPSDTVPPVPAQNTSQWPDIIRNAARIINNQKRGSIFPKTQENRIQRLFNTVKEKASEVNSVTPARVNLIDHAKGTGAILTSYKSNATHQKRENVAAYLVEQVINIVKERSAEAFVRSPDYITDSRRSAIDSILGKITVLNLESQAAEAASRSNTTPRDITNAWADPQGNNELYETVDRVNSARGGNVLYEDPHKTSQAWRQGRGYAAVEKPYDSVEMMGNYDSITMMNDGGPSANGGNDSAAGAVSNYAQARTAQLASNYAFAHKAHPGLDGLLLDSSTDNSLGASPLPGAVTDTGNSARSSNANQGRGQASGQQEAATRLTSAQKSEAAFLERMEKSREASNKLSPMEKKAGMANQSRPGPSASRARAGQAQNQGRPNAKVGNWL